MNAIWRIELLGELRVQHAERVITRFPTQKAAVLLAYLAYHPQHPHPREALIDQLWPEIDLDAARSSLRSALYSLRQLLEREEGAAGRLLIASRSTVSLHPDAFTTDVAEFQAALHSAGRSDRPTERAARLSGALAGYRGELLPGYYEPWILQERRFLAEAYLDGLHQLVTALEQAGELERALEVARQAVSTDPLRDEAHFDLMRLYAAAGQPSAVLRQYQELERLLRQELGEPPSAAARALADELRQRADDVACRRAAAPGARRSALGARLGMEADQLAAWPDIEPSAERRAPRAAPKAPVPFHRNLPLQLTRFIGRSREMAEVQELLGTSRLLTLTGAGGCGKTRLALEVASQPLPDAGEGIWLVELAPLSDPERLPQALATVLEAGEEPRAPAAARRGERDFDRAAVSDGGRAPGAEPQPLLTQTLVEHLQPRRLLLLLDNCEHLLAACAQLVERVLRHCPQVRILATSREGLGLPGEQIYRVPSLLLPDARQLPPMEQLQECEAVRLFADRAALSHPGFAVTPANAASVVQICRQLDGMPLAIELAAARLRVMEVEQLAARLDDRFRLLTGGSRTALPRQQTLQATLDWSYDLLSEAERALLRGLSVFAGGFTLEAAEAVCAPGATRAASPRRTGNVLDQLLGLVEKSLVGYEPQHGEARYRLLETVRQYAREKLAGSGELALEFAAEQVEPEERRELARRHVAFFLALAVRADAAAEGEEGAARLQEVEREYDNLRAALDGCLQSDPSRDAAAMTEDVELGLALGAALGSFWITRCYFAEGRRYLTALLARSEGRVSCDRARALTIAGRLAQLQDGGPAASYRLLEEGLAMARALEDRPLVAETLLFIVDQAPRHLTARQCQALCEEALALYRELGDRRGMGVALITLGLICITEDARRARALFEEGTVVLRELGSPRGLAWACFHLRNAQYLVGEYESASEVGRESLPLFEQYADLVGIAACHQLQGAIALARGDLPNARLHFERDREYTLEVRSQSGETASSMSCNRLGDLELAEGDVDAAEALYQQALAIAREVNKMRQVVDALTGLGRAALRRGNPKAAASLFVECLSVELDWHPLQYALPCLEGLACALTLEAGPVDDPGPLAAAAAPPRLLRAARLLGAAEAVRERIGIARPPREQSEHEGWIATLRASLGNADFAAAWEAGRTLSWEETMACALEGSDASPDEGE